MRVGLMATVVALVCAGASAQVSVFRPSPLKVAPSPAQTGQVEVVVDDGIVGTLKGFSEVTIGEFTLSDGHIVALELEPISVDVGPTWIVDDSGRAEPIQRAPEPVDAWTGRVLGHPGSRVFLGFDGDLVHGYIESSFGLDMVVTDPATRRARMYRVGDERGGVDVPPPPTGLAATEAREIQNEHMRVLAAIADPDSPLHGRVELSMIMELINRSAGTASETLYYERGGCCIAPGYCFYLDEQLCSELCTTDSVNCDDLIYACGDPSDIAPCFLGVGVQCRAQWVCYESFDDPADPSNPATGNWYGACCFMEDDDCDPDTPAVLALADMQSCECAIVGGRFIVPPDACLGGELPWEFPADRFVSAQTLEDTGQFNCSEPFGACCLDQALLCADAGDEENLPDLSSIRCAQLPRVVCESDDPQVLAALNTAVPGEFILECMPCLSGVDLSLYDGIVLPDEDSLPSQLLSNDSPPMCSGYSTVFEPVDPDDPESDEEPTEILAPENLRCVPMEILFDTDQFYLSMFAGDASAAAGYARILASSVFAMIEEDTTLRFTISGIVLHTWGIDQDGDGADDFSGAPLSVGACCFGPDVCLDNVSEQVCVQWTGQWEGQGSSCWTEPCGGAYSPTDDALAHAPLDVTLVLTELESAWLENSNGWAGDEATSLQQTFCTSAAVIALGAGPYAIPVDSAPPPLGGPAQGIRRQGVVTSGLDVLCERSNAFAVVPVRGGFAPPAVTTPPGESMWDFVQLSRAMGLLAGVRETALYGYDDCVFFPCDSMAALPDCTLRYENPEAFALGVMPSTLMSSCLTCEGSIANLQLRYRSETCARMYANVSQADCRSELPANYPLVCSSLDGDPYSFLPASPYPVSDTIEVLDYTTQGSDLGTVQLDVRSNDVRLNCNSTSNGDDLEIFIDADMPECDPADPTAGFQTVLGGYVCTDEDGLFVEYTPPPAPWCGIDSFEYRLVVEPSGSSDPATVWIVPGSCSATDAFQCGSCGDGDCSTCPQSIAEIPAIPSPPSSDAPEDVFKQVFTGRVGEMVDQVAWEYQLQIDTSQSAASDAVLRYWFTSTPGGTLDVYLDIWPFAVSDEAQCSGPFEIGTLPLGGGIECLWASGVCPVPGLTMYLPDTDGDGNADVLVQCYELSDDVAGADACWTSVDVCIQTSPAGNTPGVCCLDGLCIQLTPAECANLQWYYDTDADEWVYDQGVSGFFHGAGTECGSEAWCVKTAPCCLPDDGGCVEIEPSVCEDTLLGTVLTVPIDEPNGGTPLWDFECAFTVCGTDPLTTTLGACCVESDAGISFCATTTLDVCDGITSLAPAGQVWTSVWQVRATCDGFFCAHAVGDTSGIGACCFEVSQCCTENIEPDVCAAAQGEYLGDGSTCGMECGFTSISGACCLPSFGESICIENLRPQVCGMLGGSFTSTIDGCHDSLPCNTGFPAPVNCCIEFDMIQVLTDEDCLTAGGWIASGGTCDPVNCEIVFDADPDTPPDDPVIFQTTTAQQCTDVGGVIVAWLSNGDLDGDGVVNWEDLLILLDQWGTGGGSGDLDGDYSVGIRDLLQLLEHWVDG